MKICHKCGFENLDDAVFCEECGERLTESMNEKNSPETPIGVVFDNESKQAAEEAEHQRKEAEEAERQRKEAEVAERQRKEAEVAERQRKEAEVAERQRKEAEEAEHEAEERRARIEAEVTARIEVEEAERMRREAEEAERKAEERRARIEAEVTARIETEKKAENEGESDVEIKTVRTIDWYEKQISIYQTAIKEIKYNDAVVLLNKGKCVEAKAAFEELGDYKDSAIKAKALLEQNKSEKLKTCAVGDKVYFGTYDQDNDDNKKDIEWLVLNRQDNKALLISNKALDCKVYNTRYGYGYVSWETSTLRNWLNNEFLNKAFSTEEQARILNTTVIAEMNSGFYKYAVNNTVDKVFLLSIGEAYNYFASDEARICGPTAYAKAQGAFIKEREGVSDGEASWWWLRTTGYRQCYNAYVDETGSIYSFGRSTTDGAGCIRPTLWISMDS